MIDNKQKLLYNELISLLYNQFKLKIKLKNNSLREVHLIKKNRKDIAKIKTLISIYNKIGYIKKND